MPPQNPYQLPLQGLQGVTLNMADPRNKNPRRFNPTQGQPMIPLPGRGSPGVMGSANDPVDAYSGGLDLRDELGQSLANTPPEDSYAVNRLKMLMGQNQRGLDSSIIPKQQADYDAFNTSNTEATRQGFGQRGSTPTTMGDNPLQSREIYKRNQEQEKMRQPLEVANIEQAGGLARAQEQSRGLYGQAKVGADVKSQGFDMLNRAFGGGADGLPPGASLSLSGIGSVRSPQQGVPPNAAFESIKEARMSLQAAKDQAKPGWFGTSIGADDQTPMRQKALDDAIQGYLGQLKGRNPRAKSLASDIYNTYETDGLDAASIIESLITDSPETFDELGEDGMMEFEEILRTILGK